MKVKFLSIFLFAVISASVNANAQSKLVSLSNGDGWYRIIRGASAAGGGMVRIYGSSGNNRQTLITMNVSLMRFGQGGSINISDNLFYNTNHVDQIRGGSVGSDEYVLDIHFVGINTPSNLWITVDGHNLPILDSPVFNPTPPDRNVVDISGRVVGTTSTRWPVFINQNVGIGVANPDSKLVVDGKIRSEEVKVEIVNAPDYVFSSDYQLSTLEETAAYIEENHHLPEIPSAAEMEANGVELGEMNMLLLKKIEELTLHVIELSEQNQELKKEINKIKVSAK
ncbi:hypothetical protein [Reichenbachiella ulvae]|uniref:Chaperone of endosialidase n=1 Tax=Reichenbachiella ulvae TaxID=2980104 RepID=A0ABT3CUS7_9BACT|nr:hypothetical protein [Reichenbachiella ulvae]MCV9387446.1 hypothetical protein [Reichenbachiella ulvae]